ncbi:hypothetical protein HS7_20240 [Sulfolobales archaeon HS-7]|nr:hypothetical protein HS7_20240 [Sulfolobales archaeon HS-7]
MSGEQSIKCYRCEVRESIVNLNGRKLCPICARNEINNAIRKNFLKSGLVDYESRFIILELNGLEGLSKIIEETLTKIAKKTTIYYQTFSLELSSQSVDSYIHDAIIRSLEICSKEKPNGVVMPFPAEIFMYLLISSAVSRDAGYLSLYTHYTKIGSCNFCFPLHNISLLNMEIVYGVESKFPVASFTHFLIWVKESLEGNQEILHSFHKSIELFATQRKCTRCGAFSESDICKRCRDVNRQ